MLKMNGFRLLLSVLLLDFAGALPAFAGRPAPPPIKFQLKLLALPTDSSGGCSVLDMNNLGSVVGGYSVADTSRPETAFVANPLLNSTHATRLDLLVNPADIPAGWYVSRATGINDDGVIIGYLCQPDRSFWDAAIGFAVYGAGGPNPTMVLLPDRANASSTPWTWVYPEQVNDDGDILCTFQENGTYYAYVFNPVVDTQPNILPMPILGDQRITINNGSPSSPPQVAGNLASGEIFRYSLGDAAPEVFSAMSYYSKSEYIVMGINDAGNICGRRINKATHQAFNFDGITLQAVNASNGAADINHEGDMVIWGYAQLYHQQKGLLKLSDLVVGSAADLALWNNSGWQFSVDLTERGALSLDQGSTNFPAVAGRLTSSSAARPIFFLLPVSPEK